MKKYLLFALIGVFTMHQSFAHVELVYPDGGETFYPDETITIEWAILVGHNTLNWDLFFSSDGGNTWEVIQLDIPVETLTYQWLVPESITTQGRIRIVMDNEGTDYEDMSGDFTIASVSGISDKILLSDAKVFPNPCSSVAHFRYSILDTRYSLIELYTIQGIKIRTLINEVQTPGEYELEFDVSGMPVGFYIFRMMSGSSYVHSKLIVIH